MPLTRQSRRFTQKARNLDVVDFSFILYNVVYVNVYIYNTILYTYF